MLNRLTELRGMLRMSRTQLDTIKKERLDVQDKMILEKKAEVVLQDLTKRGAERLVNLLIAGLQSIYGTSYTFRRDGAKLMVSDGGTEVELAARGGGITDVVSLLLRVLSLYQGKGGALRTLFLDEPLKSVDTTTAVRASRFFRVLAEKLGINVVMVSHRDDIIDDATDVYRVKRVSGKTQLSRFSN